MDKPNIDYLLEILRKDGLKTIKKNVIVIRIFDRLDGFQKVEKLKFKELNKNDFYTLTRKEWRIILPKKIGIFNADDITPSYLENNKIIMYPKDFKWTKNKKKLYIYYEER